MINQPNRNPYIIGRSIHEPEKFFGREELFKFIEDNLNNNIQFLLLYGQRRIGKSSVLRQLDHKIDQQKFVFVCCDLQGHSNSSLSNILYNIIQEIIQKLSLNSDIINLPSEEELRNDEKIFSETFLPQIIDKLGEKKLVLLLDEFDVVSSDDNILDHGNRFFKYLHSLIIRHKKLFIIPVVGRSKDDFQNLSQFFKSPPFQEVGLLNELSAKQLITKPVQVEGGLEYGEDAIKTIWKLSSGHPYFTQAICFNLFLQAKLANQWNINSEDVEAIVDKTIESVEPGLVWFWDGLSVVEKVVFSVVADGQKTAINQNRTFPEDLFMQMKNYGVVQTEELIQAVKQLVNKGYLDDTEYRVKVELVRRWLVQKYPPRKEIFQLEKIKQEEINKIPKKKKQLYRGSETQEVIAHYEKILNLNPNHFITIPVLAKKHLEIENFDRALRLYTQAYQADPISNKEGLLLAREAYGEYLIKQGELIKAKIQLQKVLEIDKDRESAKKRILEIENDENNRIASTADTNHSINKDRNRNSIFTTLRRKLGVTTVFFLGTIGIGIGIGIGYAAVQFFSECPSGKQKEFALFCIENKSNISSGDRTLFFSTPKIYRDEGIKAFQQGNYPQAIQFFQQAITADRSDPEVRIYYNNAKAREKVNPFTLAVVVPAENGKDRAQEILRGVAQSQEQFNANGGRDGRLLEILIANDGDDEKKAQQIAQYLVNDKSVLGVIGHGSSKTTKPALDNVYEQAGIPFISPTSSANTLQGKNFFRTTPSDAAFGEKLAQYAIDSGLNKVVIVYNSDNPYSNSLKGKFENKFTGEIISQIDLNKKTLNIEQELQDSASQQVQAVILLPNVEHIAAALDIAKENATKNLGLKLLGGDALYNQKTLQDGGNAVEGLVIAVPWFRDAPQAKSFSQAAKQMWGGEVSWRTATSYDAAQAFINSLSAQPSRETILQKLRQTDLSDRATSGNELKFQKGERQNEAILIKVESGEFRCLKQCSP